MTSASARRRRSTAAGALETGLSAIKPEARVQREADRAPHQPSEARYDNSSNRAAADFDRRPPVYNCAGTIAQAISSIVGQSFKDLGAAGDR